MKHDQPSLVNGAETPILFGTVAGYSRLSFQTACQIEHNAVHSTHSATSPEPTNVALFRRRQAPQAPRPVVGRWHGGGVSRVVPSNHLKTGIAGASQKKMLTRPLGSVAVRPHSLPANVSLILYGLLLLRLLCAARYVTGLFDRTIRSRFHCTSI